MTTIRGRFRDWRVRQGMQYRVNRTPETMLEEGTLASFRTGKPVAINLDSEGRVKDARVGSSDWKRGGN